MVLIAASLVATAFIALVSAFVTSATVTVFPTLAGSHTVFSGIVEPATFSVPAALAAPVIAAFVVFVPATVSVLPAFARRYAVSAAIAKPTALVTVSTSFVAVIVLVV